MKLVLLELARDTRMLNLNEQQDKSSLGVALRNWASQIWAQVLKSPTVGLFVRPLGYGPSMRLGLCVAS